MIQRMFLAALVLISLVACQSPTTPAVPATTATSTTLTYRANATLTSGTAPVRRTRAVPATPCQQRASLFTLSGQSTTYAANVTLYAQWRRNVFAAGYAMNSSSTAKQAGYWLNSTWNPLANPAGSAYNAQVKSLVVSGTNVYAAGWADNGTGGSVRKNSRPQGGIPAVAVCFSVTRNSGCQTRPYRD